MAKPLILLSGGIDSALLLYYASDRDLEAVALHVYYGQPAGGVELHACQDLAAGVQTRLIRTDATIPGMSAMKADAGEDGPRVIPARNAILCSLAVATAADLGFDEVWIGCNASDRVDYPDCGKAFIKAMSETAYFATDGQVRVRAPLLDVSKREIIRQAKSLGVPLETCWSCYTPIKGRACGTCNSCQTLTTAIGEVSCELCHGHKEGKTLIRGHASGCPNR